MVITYLFEGRTNSTPVVQFGTVQATYNFTQIPQVSVNYTTGVIFKATLNNLVPRTRYYYRVGNDVDGYSEEYDFVAPVNATKLSDNIPIKLACVANLDAGATLQLYIPIISDLFQNENGAGLVPGNIAGGFEDTKWNNWGRIVETFSAKFPFFVAPGPLDLDSRGDAFNYANRFTMPGPYWWSYDFSVVHIVSLSSVHNYTVGSEQYQWLDNDLTLANLRRNVVPWIVVFSYAAMYAGDGPDYFFRSQIEPLLNKHGVDIYIGNGFQFVESKPIYNGVYGGWLGGGNGSNPFVNPPTVHLLVGTGGSGLREGCQTEDWAVTNLCTYGVTNITVDVNNTLYGMFRQIQIEHTFQMNKVPGRCPRSCSNHGNCSSVFSKCICAPNYYGADCSIFMKDEKSIPNWSDWLYSATFTPNWDSSNTTNFNSSGWLTGTAPLREFLRNYNSRDKQSPGGTTLTNFFNQRSTYLRKEFNFTFPTNNGSWVIRGSVVLTERPSSISLNGYSLNFTTLSRPEYYFPFYANFSNDQLVNGTNVLGIYYSGGVRFFDAALSVQSSCQPFYYGSECNLFLVTTGTTGVETFITTASPLGSQIDINTAVSSSTGSGTNAVGIILGVLLPVIFLTVAGGLIAFLLIRKRNRDRQRKQEEEEARMKLDNSNSINSNYGGELGKDWEIDYNEIEIGDELGRGAFGVVYRARWRNADCVVKQMHSQYANDRVAFNNFLKEANNMKNLRPHPNVCDLLGVCTKPTTPICIVTELLSEGSLVDLFNSGKIQIDSTLAVTIAKDIASGMSHLHKENILHCDLAARNLLVSLKGKDQYVIKVADFGLSHISEADNYNLKAEAKFPIRWSAPEVMTRGQVSKAADVWSFGVVMWEIIEWEKPYSKIANNSDVMRMVCNEGMRLDRPKRITIPDTLWEIMQACWQSNPKTRPTFQDLYKQLGDLEASLGVSQTPVVFMYKGNQYNYMRSPPEEDYTRSPLENKDSFYTKTPADNKPKDNSFYTKTPADNNKPKDNYMQTPAKDPDTSNYMQTPYQSLPAKKDTDHYTQTPAPKD